MEVVRYDVESKAAAAGPPSSITPVIQRTRLRPWFIWVCSSILLWTCLVQLVAVGELWRLPFFGHVSNRISRVIVVEPLPLVLEDPRETPLLPSVPTRNYTSNGFLKVSCNGGLNQMRAAICDMVTIARLLNLTLVVPELDKTSFWADPSDFEDIFDVGYFIASLRDEVRIIKRLPKRYTGKYGYKPLRMPPVSWSNEKYYLEQILPLFNKHKVLHFNKTDSRLANNGLSLDLQKLRCRVNFQALRFTPEIESLGNKLVHLLRAKGPFVALHLRYEMDMLAFSGCTHGCSAEEAEELKKLRLLVESSLGLRTMLDFEWYAFPWWREKEIMSEERRSQGLCPLTPEETALVLRALGFDKDTQIYIASGEIYGSERRLAVLQDAFPRIVKKEVLLSQGELKSFQKHTSQMAALDFIVSVASDTFVPTYDGNMAKLVEGHRRYLGFKMTILLDRRRLVDLLDLHLNGTISWDVFQVAVRKAHEKKMGQPARRRVIADKPKEEDYFYANPRECLCEKPHCDNLLDSNSSI